jgi:FkbM family methyltransferase
MGWNPMKVDLSDLTGLQAPLRAVDVHGFGGGFTAGAVRAGFQLVGKREGPGGFGVSLFEANRALLGDQWKAQACDAKEWEPVAADVVIGTPPCTAFSNMSAGFSDRGADAAINHCMWDLIRYAAKVKPGVVVMESVAGAYTKGLPLMEALRVELCERSGLMYRATHVLQNNLSLGGCTNRKRYFLVLSQVPFGVESANLHWLPTVGDAISDLSDLQLGWESQHVDAAPTWWSASMRTADHTVDGHQTPRSNHGDRLTDLVTPPDGVSWEPGDRVADVLQRYYAQHERLPESWRYQFKGRRDKSLPPITREEQLVTRGMDPGGFGQTRYWPWDQPGSVINGAGPHMIWHPSNRIATHREVARLMGFPDEWRVGSAAEDKQLHMFWGKGTSVHPAWWIMTWARESLLGHPGEKVGDELPDGSRLVDVSGDWRPVARKQWGQEVETEGVTREKKTRGIRQSRGPRVPRVRPAVPEGFQMRESDHYCVDEVFVRRVYRQLKLSSVDIVLDLGAHVGAFTRWARDQGAGAVHAVEMMPETLEYLVKNTESDERVHVLHGAVSGQECDQDGMVQAVLHSRGNPMGAFVNGTRKTLGEGIKAQAYRVVEVPAISMLALLHEIHPTIIKFDIETSEYDVITPWASTIRGYGVKQLIGEHHVMTPELVQKAQELHASLVAQGYVASRPAPTVPSNWGTVIYYTLPDDETPDQ